MTPLRSLALAGLWLAVATPSAASAQALADDNIRAPRFLLAVAGTRTPINVQRTPSLRRHVALDLDGVPLAVALEEISRRSGLRLAYTDDVLPRGARVRLVASDISVAGALSTVLLDAGVDVVFTRDGQASLVRRDALAPNGSVVGQVTDAKTASGIAGVDVSLEGTRWRTTTDGGGRYRLVDVTPGSYTVLARRIGYGPERRALTVRVGQEATVDLVLQTSPTMLADVVVTAEKREERLLDVPQSVSVLPADELAKLGAVQFRDFANTIPGLSFATVGAGNTQITLRGITTGLDISPTTAIYVDEVPIGAGTFAGRGGETALDVGLFDVERIEVLRGPQGTLYGTGSMGGLIKYVSPKPTSTHLGGSIQTSLSSTSHGGVSYTGAAAINVPIAADKAALRVSAFESHDGGFVDNVALGQRDVNRSDVYGARADLLLTPIDALSVRFQAFLQNISRDGEADADYTLAGAQPYGSLGQYRPFGEPFEQRARIFSGTMTYNLGSTTLTSVSSYQQLSTEYVWDLSTLFVPIFESAGRSYSAVGVPVDLDTKKFAQELRLASQGSHTFEWVVGGFFSRETSGQGQQFALRDMAGQPAPNDVFGFYSVGRFKEYAVFGDLTWHLTDRFDVTGGLRFRHNSVEGPLEGSRNLVTGAPSPPLATWDDDGFTYLANARYRLSDRATGYLRYATGYRAGGPNAVQRNPVTGELLGADRFESDNLDSYEVGVKAETEDRKYGLDLAAFYIDWSNLQVNVNRGGFGGVLNAAGGAVVQGVELTLNASPIRDFVVRAASSYTDAHLTEADIDLGGHKGERLPSSPRFSGTLITDYRLQLGSWQPTVGTTIRHVGDRTASFDGNAGIPQYRLPDYTTVDIRAGVLLGSVRASLLVHNLFDERGQFSLMIPQFGGRVAIQPPRTIGINLTTQFGR